MESILIYVWRCARTRESNGTTNTKRVEDNKYMPIRSVGFQTLLVR